MRETSHAMLDQLAGIGNQAANNRYAQYAPLQTVDPTTKLANAITDHAAAIRELADVLYHIGAED